MVFNATFNNIYIIYIMLYHGSQFHWWRKQEYLEKTTDLSQVTDKLYHIMMLMLYRIHVAMSKIRTRDLMGDKYSIAQVVQTIIQSRPRRPHNLLVTTYV